MHAEIKISPSGNLVFVYDDELLPLLALGHASVQRASHVEPIGSGARAGEWTVNCKPFCARFGLPAPRLLGPYPTRHSALFAEKAFLERELFGAEVLAELASGEPA